MSARFSSRLASTIPDRRVALAFVSAALLAVGVASPRVARAEDEASRLFREGRAAMLDGRYDEACPMIAESQRLDPHVGTLLNLAACHEKQGKVGSAWVEYQKALTSARTEGQTDRAKLAEARITAIEPRVPWIKLVATKDTTVTLDGGVVAPVAFGTEMPVDPGAHVVTARGGGDGAFETRVDLREGEHRSVVVELAEPLPPLEEPRPQRVVVDPHPLEPAAKPKETNRWVVEPGIFGAAAIIALDRPRPEDGGGGPELFDDSRNPPTRLSCESAGCTYDDADGTRGVIGISVLLGYAVSDVVTLGVRGVLATSPSNTATVGAIGPAISFAASSRLRVGGWAGFSDFALSGIRTTVTIPSRYRTADASLQDVEGSLAGALGLGLELSYRIADFQRGALYLSSTPFFGSGQGTGLLLPAGLAYRFQ